MYLLSEHFIKFFDGKHDFPISNKWLLLVKCSSSNDIDGALNGKQAWHDHDPDVLFKVIKYPVVPLSKWTIVDNNCSSRDKPVGAYTKCTNHLIFFINKIGVYNYKENILYHVN